MLQMLIISGSKLFKLFMDLYIPNKQACEMVAGKQIQEKEALRGTSLEREPFSFG